MIIRCDMHKDVAEQLRDKVSRGTPGFNWEFNTPGTFKFDGDHTIKLIGEQNVLLGKFEELIEFIRVYERLGYCKVSRD